jgi:hypothetical protein
MSQFEYDATTEDWIFPTWNLLYAAETSCRPLEEVASRHSLDIQRANELLEQASYLRELPSAGAYRHRMEKCIPDHREPHNFRIIACPRRLIHDEDTQVIDCFATPLAEMATHIESDMFQRALRCYVHQVWRDRDLVVFHSLAEAAEAKNYVEFLSRLGILRQDIRWISFDDRQKSSTLASWKRALGLNRHNKIERLKAPNSSAGCVNSWLAIEPRFHFHSAHAKLQNPGAFGFRFLMTMGFIAFGLPCEIGKWVDARNCHFVDRKDWTC